MKLLNKLNVTCSGWILLHIMCFINSLTMVGIFYTMVPKKEGFDIFMIIGIIPFIVSIMIHVCYKINSDSTTVLPMYNTHKT